MRSKIHNLVNGDDRHARIYGRMMSVIIIASLIPLCFKETNTTLFVIEHVCVTFFIVEYIARWATADYKLGRGKASFAIYPFTPMAIIDLVSILPTFLALNAAFKALRLLRLIRAMRAFKLVRYSKGVNAIAAVLVKQKQPLLVVLGFAVAYILISALVVFNAEPDTFDSFFDAVYWAVVSLTTVGYGDLYPVSTIGKTVAMVSSLMGVAIVALPAGIITAGMVNELSENQQKED